MKHILTDLRRYDKLRNLATREQKSRTEGRLLPCEGDLLDSVRCRGEMAHLLKFRILRQMRLGYDTEQLTVCHHSGGVIELPIDTFG